MFLIKLMEVRKWPYIFIDIISQEHSGNISGTIREQGTRVFERNRPQQIAGGERYEICINQIITHIDGRLRILRRHQP